MAFQIGTYFKNISKSDRQRHVRQGGLSFLDNGINNDRKVGYKLKQKAHFQVLQVGVSFSSLKSSRHGRRCRQRLPTRTNRAPLEQLKVVFYNKLMVIWKKKLPARQKSTLTIIVSTKTKSFITERPTKLVLIVVRLRFLVCQTMC